MTFSSTRAYTVLFSVSSVLLASFDLALSVPSPRQLHNAVVNDKVMMPLVGLGTGAYGRTTKPGPQPEIWNNTNAYKYATLWFKQGGRYIDTALTYHTQQGIGRALNDSGLKREEVWITSKIPMSNVSNPYNTTLANCAMSLQELGVKQVDLMLSHWPGKTSMPTWHRQEQWRALVDFMKSGGARAVGVSNYEAKHLKDLEDMKDTPLPAVNQIEFHPFFHQDELAQYCQQRNITMDSYAPFGAPDVVEVHDYWKPTCLNNSKIVDIANNHKMSSAQVILSWILNQGFVTHPRTRNPQHMADNLAAAKLVLAKDEMDTISKGLTVPDCSKLKSYTCPEGGKTGGGCCKICPETSKIP